MGSFMGHFIPGFGFFLLATWWLCHSLVRFFRHRFLRIPFQSKASYTLPCYCFCKKRSVEIPVEAALKGGFPILGIVVEASVGYRDGKMEPMNAQHITMYFAFVLSGLVDFLLYFDTSLPKGIDYVAFILANLIEMILFLFHLHHRTPTDVHVHMLLVYTLAIIIFICLVDMAYPNQPLAALAKSYILFVKAVWYVQVGYILYNPTPFPGRKEWFKNDPEEIMSVTIYYALNLGASFFFYVLITVCFGTLYRTCCATTEARRESRAARQPLLGDTGPAETDEPVG